MDNIFSFLAEYFYLIVIAAALLLIALRYRANWQELVLATLFIGIVSYLLSKLGTDLISDPRPFIQTGIPALIPSATDNGFPSDHTLLLAVIAAVFGVVSWRMGLVFVVLALIVGLARVYARVHHLLDIAGSFGIVVIAGSLYLVLRQLFNNSRQSLAKKQ